MWRNPVWYYAPVCEFHDTQCEDGAATRPFWLFLRKRKTMSQLPIGVGDTAAQRRFIAAHKSFLLEFPKLKRTLETLIDESHKKVSEQRSKVGDDPQTDEDIARPIVF